MKNVQMKKVFGHLTVCALVASACFGLGGCNQSEQTRSDIDNRVAEAKNALDGAQKVRSVTFDPLKVTNKVWGGNASLRMQRGMPLPARYEANRGVTLVSSDAMSIEDVVNAISAQTGIPIRLSALTIAGKNPAQSSSASASTKPGMPVSYEGPLSGLLDRVSAYFGVSWRFDGSSIAISRFETRIFSVEVMPGTHQINEGMEDDETSSNSSSGSGSSGSSGSSSGQNSLTQNSKTTMDLKYWDELTAVLNSIVGSHGSVVVSPTMGTVTITTTPEVMATVADYISKENKRQSRQIAINVTIYNVNLSKSEDFNVAFSAFLNKYTNIGGLSFTGAQVPAIAAQTLESTAFSSLNLAIIDGGRMGANDIFSALSAIGDTTTVANFPMTTLNNRPVSRRVGTDTTYISEITQNTTSSTSTTTIATPTTSVIHDGFSLQLTPRILDDGRILLQYSLSLIGLQGMPEAGDASATYKIGLPITDNRILIQQSMLRSGQTLMIGGIDQQKLGQNKQGVGSADNFLLGGGVSSANSHLMMFMAITPQVMDMGNEERR